MKLKQFWIGMVLFPVLVNAGNITFMTYNLLTNSGLNFQSSRIVRHAQLIASTGADVVAVQEVVGSTNFNTLKSNSGLAGSWFDIAGNGYGIGILWNPALGTPTLTNVKVNPTSGSTDKESRAYIIAEFPHFYFISTHYSLNAVDRDSMTARIIRFAKQAGKTVFVAGDFNAQPTYRAMVTFKNNQFVILNDPAENTYPSTAPTSLIDMILGYRQNSTDAPYTVISRGIPVPPAGVVLKDISDHLPYVVRINLQVEDPNATPASSTDSLQLTTHGRNLNISSPGNPLHIEIYSINGSCITRLTAHSSADINLPPGSGRFFIVSVNGKRVKVGMCSEG
ncbi:MAG: endonuclease/exonuclease/phosphatase family protein [Paludibacter sp.]|jgi:endonuclease/exonuclease/phosphatase family metal-dependent hydrolase|nr:endonuclease/exonuclease/phosphatase family protein [Paludibacter sp.]